MDRFRVGPTPALFFAAAAVVLTWPLVWSPGASISVRGDYYLGLWNFWWLYEALFELGASPYATDFLHFPLGVSLVRHVLSPANALAGGALSAIVGGPAAFELLLLVHFWLSAWFFFLFARELTGSPGGAALAGLVWSFAPFHFYYLPQMNVATMEFLPLAGYFLVRVYRSPGLGPAFGAALSAALLAATSSYYLVYAALLGGGLLLAGRLWEPERPWRPAAIRLGRAGALSALAVVAVSWRVFAEGFGGAATETLEHRIARSNDLLGFLWVGGPEAVIVSWPTMLGYTAIAITILGFRPDRRRLFWLGAGLLFVLLSLGPRLHVGGELRELALPDAWLAESPLTWMLRKPDRMFAMVQLCFGLLLAYGWRDLAARWIPVGRQGIAWAVCASVLCIELAAVPLAMFDDAPSPGFAALAKEEGIRVVANLPAVGGGPRAARSNRDQTIHGARITDGYVVNLALRDEHWAANDEWREAHKPLREAGDARPLVALARERGVDALVVYKTILDDRESEAIPDGPIWAPFALRAGPLLGIRQRGHLAPRLRFGAFHVNEATGLGLALGPPLFSDATVSIYRVPPERR